MDITDDVIWAAAIAVYHRDCPEIEGTSLGWRMSPNQQEYCNVARAAIMDFLRQMEEAGYEIVPSLHRD